MTWSEPRRPRTARQDRALIWAGVVCVVFAGCLQYHRGALWFQMHDPYQHPTQVVKHGR